MACSQPGLQFRKGTASRVAEDQVEIAQAALRNVFDRLSGAQTVESHAAVEVVETPDSRRRVEHDLGCCDGVWTVGCDDRGIGVGELRCGAAPDVCPLAIQDQVAAGELRHVAMFRIVRHITLEEDDAMAQLMKGPDQAPP